MTNTHATQGTSNGKLPPAAAAALAAIVALVIALAVLEILTILGVADDALVVTVVLLLPLFVYLAVSGKLKELRAPGGWGAVFIQTSRQPLKRPELILPKVIKVHDVYKEPTEAELRHNPNSLKVTLEEVTELFSLCDYLYFLDNRLATGTVRYIIFVDRSENFVALLPVTSISTHPTLLTSDGQCKAFRLVEWICQRDFEKLAGLNGFVDRENAASMAWTKGDCLRQMFNRNLDALPVIKESRLLGIVERTRLLTSILVDIAANNSED